MWLKINFLRFSAIYTTFKIKPTYFDNSVISDDKNTKKIDFWRPDCVNKKFASLIQNHKP